MSLGVDRIIAMIVEVLVVEVLVVEVLVLAVMVLRKEGVIERARACSHMKGSVRSHAGASPE